MSLVYVDFEKDDRHNIIEMGAIVICKGQFKHEFHHFVEPQDDRFNTFNYYRTAENSHCIPLHVLYSRGISHKTLQLRFEDLIKSLPQPILIYGHGDDITRIPMCHTFPFLVNYGNDIIFNQVTLPNWAERSDKLYHLSAMDLKTHSRVFACHQDNHEVIFSPYWKRVCQNETPCKVSKYNYGFHCALVDAYELAFYHGTVKHYCCDPHFLEHYPFLNKQLPALPENAEVEDIGNF